MKQAVRTAGKSALGVCILLLNPLVRADAIPPAAPIRAFVEKNCFSCHNAEKHKGDLDLAAIMAGGGDIGQNRDAWEDVLDRIEKGEMPPKKQKRPDPAEMHAVTELLKADFARDDANAKQDIGHVTARRLNRSEYNNSVRDLLGVNSHPADDFPPDDAGYGFDNIGDVLSASPILTEKYLKAAEKIARQAVYGVEKLKPVAVTHEPWNPDYDTVRVVKTDYDESGLTLKYASNTVHRFPVSADYEIIGWLRGDRPSGSDPIHLGFWIDGKMVHEGIIAVPKGGELNGLNASFKTHITAGDHWIATSILKIYEGLPAAYKGPHPSTKPARVGKLPTVLFCQNIRVVGPFDQEAGPAPESLEKLYVCGHLDGKHDADCARKIVTNLARRAFRRPPTAAEVHQLLGLVALAQQEGDSFEEGLCLAIEKVLVSPSFLFRAEIDPPGEDASTALHSITPNELATRLSYFIWSSIPDDELMRAANDSSITKPDIMESQVRRLLKDPKAGALVENFGGQWLQFRGIESHAVERKKFQQFTDYTRLSMSHETELYFEHIMREDRSILEFIDSNYTFLNQRMAEFYGIPGVVGTEWRKVALPAGSHRGGVLTQASVLTVSSYATRTSPVIRGKWVLENFLNAAPPPPPPDIPNLKDDVIGSTASMREQLQKHRENPTCASCHSRMDPLGFALENFDGIGSWRVKEGKFDIDSTGELPDGRTFNGPDELKTILLSDKDAFARCVADKMLTYALGRGVTRADRTTIKKIAEQLANEDYRFSALVMGVVRSPQFQMRSSATRGAP